MSNIFFKMVTTFADFDLQWLFRMCDNNKNQDINLSHGKIDLMSSYFKKNEEEDCMDVPQKSIHLKTIYVDEDFECLLWQRNWWWDRQIWDNSVLEVLEEDRVIRDSQRLGLWRSWDIRLEVADGKHGMDTRKRPPPLNAETLATWGPGWWRRWRCSSWYWV